MFQTCHLCTLENAPWIPGEATLLGGLPPKMSRHGDRGALSSVTALHSALGKLMALRFGGKRSYSTYQGNIPVYVVRLLFGIRLPEMFECWINIEHRTYTQLHPPLPLTPPACKRGRSVGTGVCVACCCTFSAQTRSRSSITRSGIGV